MALAPFREKSGCYEKGYILVRMEDVWSEQPNEAGEMRMVRNTLMLPEGKKGPVQGEIRVLQHELVQQSGGVQVLGQEGLVGIGVGTLGPDLTVVPHHPTGPVPTGTRTRGRATVPSSCGCKARASVCSQAYT